MTYFQELQHRLATTQSRIVLTDKKDIEFWLLSHGIEDYVIMDNLSVAVGKSVVIRKTLPFFPVNFTNIWGAFECPKVGLRSLEGAPHTVEGDFDVGHNFLTSLQGSPLKVEGCFKASNNQLTSLAHGPKEVAMYFADKNPLKTLEDLNTFVFADMWEGMSNFFITVDEQTSIPLRPVLCMDKTQFLPIQANDIVYGLTHEDIQAISNYQATQKERQELDINIAKKLAPSDTVAFKL